MQGGPPVRETGESGASRCVKLIGPNPLSANHTIGNERWRPPEAFGVHTAFRSHVDGWILMDGHDCFTIPRSERSPERPRDRGLLDLDPTA